MMIGLNGILVVIGVALAAIGFYREQQRHTQAMLQSLQPPQSISLPDVRLFDKDGNLLLEYSNVHYYPPKTEP